MKEGYRRTVLENNTIYTEMPEGWDFIEGALTAPQGYRWIHNKKSLFSPERKRGLLKLSTDEQREA